MTDVKEFLEHYGVKGMKWGVRRKSSDGKLSSTPPSADSQKATKAMTKVKKSGVKSLSNDELKTLNERLQLERTFSSLAPNTKTPTAQVADVIASTGSRVVKDVATQYITQQVKKKMGISSKK